MIKGIYTSASGMLPRILKQETFANNMANVNTPGFKKDGVFLQVLDEVSRKEIITDHPWEVPMIDDVYIDFSQGDLEKTDANTDLAIDGDGFFAIQTGSGTMYTRSGDFSLSPQGILVDKNGNPVLTDAGPLTLQSDSFTVGDDGTVTVNEFAVGRIKIVDFEKPYQLKKVGDSYLAPVDPSIAEQQSTDHRIRQGYLEKSNVNVVEVMVDMLSSFRAYEAGQKAIQAQDETLDKAVNDLGRSV
ncbi:MAG: flagellar basal-body rod protein FlgF [Candidatus Zixiibacteriota bacterium]|nr:MAG: flagellar basal-body rod protein FlgF [candidate division Zixibacteria bacterium]